MGGHDRRRAAAAAVPFVLARLPQQPMQDLARCLPMCKAEAVADQVNMYVGGSF